MDTPSWLSDEPSAPAAEAAAPPPASAPTVTSFETSSANAAGSMLNNSKAAKASASAAPSPAATVDESDLPRIILIMRLSNMGVVVALITVSILKMVSLPSPALWVLSVYATCGGILVCCLETQLKFLRVAIAMNFGFLFSPIFRFFFYVLLASLSWSFDRFYTRIVAIALVVVAVFNTYVLFRYPSYRAVRERIAEEEDQKIQARISSEVRKQAVKSLSEPL